MRLMLSAASAAALFLSAGCSQSEATAKAGIRNQIVTACKTQGDVYKAQVPSLDVDRFCGCMGDKFIEGKSVEQIRAFQADKAAQERGGAEAGMACFAQVGVTLPAAGAAPAAAPAAPVSAPVQSAPAPAPAEDAPAEESGEE